MRYEPEKAVATLPALLTEHTDRERLVTLLDRLLADERVQHVEPTKEQTAMLERIRSLLRAAGGARPRVVAAHG